MRVQATVRQDAVIRDLDDCRGRPSKVLWSLGFGTVVHPIVPKAFYGVLVRQLQNIM
jgi:hypothetical protein